MLGWGWENATFAGRGRLHLSAFAGVTLIIVSACGDTVTIEDPTGGASSGGGGAAVTGGVGTGNVGNMGTGNTGGFDPFDDPGCPNQPPPIEQYDCDPYDQSSGECGFGEGCYIFVQYPEEPCGQEIYGSICIPAGTGVQGDPCFGAQGCGPGFVCVVSGVGNQCVQLCSLTGDDGCPPGLVCEAIDVKGFGGCL